MPVTPERSNELMEKLILMELHFRGVPQQNAALFIGKSKAYVNEVLKPLSKRGDEK